MTGSRSAASGLSAVRGRTDQVHPKYTARRI